MRVVVLQLKGIDCHPWIHVLSEGSFLPLLLLASEHMHMQMRRYAARLAASGTPRHMASMVGPITRQSCSQGFLVCRYLSPSRSLESHDPLADRHSIQSPTAELKVRTLSYLRCCWTTCGKLSTDLNNSAPGAARLTQQSTVQ